MLEKIKHELHRLKNPGRAKILSRFFKTGKGEYGEGDIFLGIQIPQLREIAKRYKDISLKSLEELIKSRIHEHRMVAVLILVERYQKSDKQNKYKIAEFYLSNRSYINNWDLVDLSAPKILGQYLNGQDRSILYGFAGSKNLWERRISILSAFYFIRNNDFEDAFKISEMLLNDGHDLIHKAVGWMLREIGKRDIKSEEKFLKKHYKKMPRTMLRYAIEKFPRNKKMFYMGV
ncbi:MAG: DNA alkylation repair protein [Endomicrobiales bacterium]|nr:DNA alkylation repair protein [Endomicrobiales bacterium]